MESKRNVAHAPRRIGYVLFESDAIVVIATLKTSNRKTGPMVQIWILLRHMSPIDAVKNGFDAVICFDCPHRGAGFSKRTCYVNLRSPQGIWRAYQRGRYEYLPMERYAAVFGESKIRFGAYGEPVLLPIEILSSLASVAIGWTGYTHQWRKSEYAAYRPFLMASVDSDSGAAEAVNAGWRYFRVRHASQPLVTGEIQCPAADESGKKTTCAKCLLCNGSRENDRRKNIVLLVHGSGAKNFVTSIAPLKVA